MDSDAWEPATHCRTVGLRPDNRADPPVLPYTPLAVASLSARHWSDVRTVAACHSPSLLYGAIRLGALRMRTTPVHRKPDRCGSIRVAALPRFCLQRDREHH